MLCFDSNLLLSILKCCVGQLCLYKKSVFYIVVLCYCLHISLQQAKLETPDLSVVKSVQKISWAAGCGALHLIHATNEEVHKCYEKVNTTRSRSVVHV